MPTTAVLGEPEIDQHRIVDFDMLPRRPKGRIAVKFAHRFANCVAHAPSRFVGDTNMALDFLRGDAFYAPCKTGT